MTELTREKAREERMKAALENFENNAAAPIIPGEAVQWACEVEAALGELQPLWAQQVQRGHVSAMRQITREDPEMFRRIEQLQAEDQEITACVLDVQKRLRLLTSVTEKVDQDEKRVEAALAEFVSLALGLVVRMRKQEVAVRTWLMEAFNRDRGTVD
jgi:hypothetical protein